MFKEKLARGDGFFGDAFKMEPIIKICGLYHKGTIIKDVDIVFFSQDERRHGGTEFHVRHKLLSEKDRDFIQGVPNVKIGGNHKMYQSNPFNADIGLIKLYQDPNTEEVHRCVIDDIYCGPPKRQYLYLLATITLIDLGQSLTCDYEQIFDYSQRTGHLMDVEPEALSARLYLPGKDSDRTQRLHKILKDMISNKSGADKKYYIKILGYKDKIYEVDVITELEESFLNSHAPEDTCSSSLTSAGCSNTDGDNSSANSFGQFSETFPSARRERGIKTLPRRRDRDSIISTLTSSRREVAPNFIGAMNYFTYHLTRSHAPGSSYISNRLSKVMLLDWYEPDLIAILPYDKVYSHEKFRAKLNSLKCVQQAGDLKNKIEKKVYKPGEFVFFKNVFRDIDLGLWLRGVVVSIGCHNHHNLICAQRRTDQAKLDNFNTIVRLVNEGKLCPDDILYRVRSVDYGCEARSSSLNMRVVSDLHEFKSVGTWSLRCKLFGIYPFKGDQGEFADHSIDAFDSWIRHKFDEDDTGFRVLFKSFLNSADVQTSFDKLIDITLFHRFDQPCDAAKSLADLMKPKLARYSCLNWHLVYHGLVESSNESGTCSNIQLEDHVIQRLVQHRRL